MRKLQFLIFAMICYTSLFSKQKPSSIDQLMGQKEREKTGISKLSISEKIALKDWVDKYCKKNMRNSTSSVYPEIFQIIESGHFLVLTDHSMWQIRPKDTIITQSWIMPAPIIAQKINQGSFPYELTNDVTKSGVKARKVTHIPDQYLPNLEFYQDKANYNRKKK